MAEILALLSLDPLILGVIIGTFFVAGVVKGFLGLGMPMISMLLLVSFMPPIVAIPLIAVPTLLVNVLQFTRSPLRREVAYRYRLMSLVLVAVIFLTALYITHYPEALLLAVIGGLMVVFSAQTLLGFQLRLGGGKAWQVVIGGIAGVIGGLSSIFSPPVVMYLLARDVDKDEFIGATGFLFMIGSAPLVLALMFNGVMTPEIAIKAMLGFLCALPGFRLGEALRPLVSRDMFKTLIMVVFLIMGFRLLIGSFIGIS